MTRSEIDARIGLLTGRTKGKKRYVVKGKKK